jgi:hypothetical protein
MEHLTLFLEELPGRMETSGTPVTVTAHSLGGA